MKRRILSAALAAVLLITCSLSAYADGDIWQRLLRDDPGFAVCYDGYEYPQSYFLNTYDAWNGAVVTLVDLTGGFTGWGAAAIRQGDASPDTAELVALGTERGENFYTPDPEGDWTWEDIEASLIEELDWFVHAGASVYIYPQGYYDPLLERLAEERFAYTLHMWDILMLTPDTLDEAYARLSWGEWVVLGLCGASFEAFELYTEYEYPEPPAPEEPRPDGEASDEAGEEPVFEPAEEPVYEPVAVYTVYSTAFDELWEYIAAWDIPTLCYAGAELARSGGIRHLRDLELFSLDDAPEAISVASIVIDDFTAQRYITERGTEFSVYTAGDSVFFRPESELYEDIAIERLAGEPVVLEITENAMAAAPGPEAFAAPQALAETEEEPVSEGEAAFGTAVVTGDLTFVVDSSCYEWAVFDQDGHSSTSPDYDGAPVTAGYVPVSAGYWTGEAVVTLPYRNTTESPARYLLVIDGADAAGITVTGAEYDSALGVLTVPAGVEDGSVVITVPAAAVTGELSGEGSAVSLGLAELDAASLRQETESAADTSAEETETAARDIPCNEVY